MADAQEEYLVSIGCNERVVYIDQIKSGSISDGKTATIAADTVVYKAVCTRENAFLACGGKFKGAAIIDLKTCTVNDTTLKKSHAIRALALSHRQTVLAMPGENGLIEMMRIKDLEHPYRLMHSGKSDIVSLAFSPSDQLIASSRENGVIDISTLIGGDHISIKTGQGWVTAIEFISNETLASINLSRFVSLWNVKSGDLMHRLSEHKRIVHALFVDYQQGLLYTGGYDGKIHVWDCSDLKIRTSVDVKGPVQAFTVSESVIVAGTCNGVLWHIDSEGDSNQIKDRYEGAILGLAASKPPLSECIKYH